MHPSHPVFGGAASKSSKQWLARQFKDPYVRQRRESPAQYRSRSAFKLLEMDSTNHFLQRPRLNPSSRPRIIVDLGAAPGGWSQVVAQKNGFVEAVQGRDSHFTREDPVNAQSYGLKPTARMERRGTWSDAAAETATSRPNHSVDASPVKIIALDLLRIQPIRGVTAIQADFLAPTATELVRAHFPQDAPDAAVDLLLSDMAANASGNPVIDAENSLRICQAVWQFAEKHLVIKSKRKPGGILVLKHFVHPDTQQFRKEFLMRAFRRVSYVKPPSSRSESAEGYWVCLDWLGADAALRGPLPVDPPVPIGCLMSNQLASMRDPSK